MLRLSAAYGAKWKSAFGERELRYNERVWSPAGESHAPEDMFFGVVDKTDGSSFVIRIELLDEADDVTDLDIEDGLIGPLCTAPYDAEYLDSASIEVSGLLFQGALLAIANPKFGSQLMQLLFARAGDSVTILQLCWPRSMEDGSLCLPVKHRSLLEGLSL